MRNCADRSSEVLAECFRFLLFRPLELLPPTYDRPSRFRRNVKTDQATVRLQYRPCCFFVAVSFCQACDLIFKYIREPFDENEREDVVFELGRVFLPTN